jgi:hypothetical protein
MPRLSVATPCLGIIVWATLTAVPIITAQTPAKAPSAGRWRVPRTPDGRPDLQGVWTNMTATPLQRPRELGDKSHFTEAEAAAYARTWLERLVQEEDEEDRTGADLNEIYLDDRVVVPDLRTSLIVDPPAGRLPPLVKAAQDRLEARSRPTYDDPEGRPLGERCILGLDGGSALTAPIIPNRYSGNFYQIVQTPTHVLIFTEQIHDARIIRIGGVHLPGMVQQWLGDSIGRWEGDTLVVDTTNINTKGTVRGATARLRVVERFTRTGPSTVTYRATVEDPDTWPVSWTLEFPFEATAQRLFEYACHEGNFAVEGGLRGARADEKAGRKR